MAAGVFFLTVGIILIVAGLVLSAYIQSNPRGAYNNILDPISKVCLYIGAFFAFGSMIAGDKPLW